MECLCSNGGGLMSEIMAVRPEEFVEPGRIRCAYSDPDQQMNAFERAAYTVMRRYKKILTECLKLCENEIITAELNEQLDRELGPIIEKRKTALELMYISIRDRLDLWNCSLGVTEGFRIVIPKKGLEEIVLASIPEAAQAIYVDVIAQAMKETADGLEERMDDYANPFPLKKRKVTIH